MKNEIQSIIFDLQNSLNGEPWFGRSVYSLLKDIDPKIVFKKPATKAHSLADLLYHMITWADFTLKRIEGDKGKDMAAFEAMDWRNIDPAIHSWENGLRELREIHEAIIGSLKDKDDSFLDKIVDYRKYDFRFLLKGLIQHNIYHAGQVAYIYKLLSL